MRIPYKDILSFSGSLYSVDILTVPNHFCQYTTMIIALIAKWYMQINTSSSP